MLVLLIYYFSNIGAAMLNHIMLKDINDVMFRA